MAPGPGKTRRGGPARRPRGAGRPGRAPVELRSRLRERAGCRDRLTQRPGPRRRQAADGRRGRVAVGHRGGVRRTGAPGPGQLTAADAAPRHPRPRGVERGGLRRGVGQAPRAGRRMAAPRRGPGALGGVRDVVRGVRAAPDRARDRGSRRAARLDHGPRRRHPPQLPGRRRLPAPNRVTQCRLPGGLLAAAQQAAAEVPARAEADHVARRRAGRPGLGPAGRGEAAAARVADHARSLVLEHARRPGVRRADGAHPLRPSRPGRDRGVAPGDRRRSRAHVRPARAGAARTPPGWRARGTRSRRTGP
jgi:hypothetical protein